MTVRFVFNAYVILCFLLVLIAVNFAYFVFILKTDVEISINNVLDLESEITIEKEVEEQLQHLRISFKSRNPKYFLTQRQLIKSFNISKDSNDIVQTWQQVSSWESINSLFPDTGNWPGKVISAIKTSRIISADNAHKGTQLKFLLELEGNIQLLFKPKRYELDRIIKGKIYAGFDRHNSEVLAYYLAMVLNFKWIAPATFRKIHIKKELLPVASAGLRQTTIRRGKSACIYGSCYYCNPNDTVCEDHEGYIEGAAVLYVNKPLRINKSPWRRSYSAKKMEWQTDENFCKKTTATVPVERLLDLMETAIFDYLLQNGDRHRYELIHDKIVLLDNGKGLGNPHIDEIDILAPLYQCCRLRYNTWNQLILLSGGALSETVKMISSLQEGLLATDEHFRALDRRLLKIFAVVQMCIGKYSGAKVFD